MLENHKLSPEEEEELEYQKAMHAAYERELEYEAVKQAFQKELEEEEIRYLKEQSYLSQMTYKD
tara:strand:+ start:368 stop:559 length:192 start_codon:yes stop_codon:yes gene_type:complete